MEKILKHYQKLRAYQVPILKCGETSVPATDEMPGFLQGAVYLTQNIEEVRGCKQVKTAHKDVSMWVKHIETVGSDTVGYLDQWREIINLLKKAFKE